MGQSLYSSLPFPEVTDLDDPAGDIERLAESIDTRVFVYATNAADRDSKYQLAPVKTVCAASGVLWMKMDATKNTWSTIWEEGSNVAWRNLPYLSGFTGSPIAQIKRVGNQVFTRGVFQKSDGTYIPVTGGTTMSTVPSDCRPKAIARWSGTNSISGSITVSTGRLEVNPSGALVWCQQNDDVLWFDIGGSYWID